MEISLLLTLQALINRYCAQHGITYMTLFVEESGIDHGTIRNIYKRPAPYCPTWGAICAIAVACDLSPEQTKTELRPLYNYAHAYSERQTTAHKHRAIRATTKQRSTHVRDSIADQPTAAMQKVK